MVSGSKELRTIRTVHSFKRSTKEATQTRVVTHEGIKDCGLGFVSHRQVRDAEEFDAPLGTASSAQM